MSDQTTLSGYFGGDAKDLGTVRLHEARTFAKLVQASLNLATVLNVTRSEFRQMPKKLRDQAKRSPYLTPASFRSRRSKRHITEASFCNLIFLDIDDPKAARPYWANPQTLEEALSPFSFAVYTTANSTSAAPRVRIMVDADEIPLKAYPDAVKTIAMMIGLPSVTLESIVSVQPMFLPVIFKDDDPEIDHPVLWTRTDGAKFSADDIQSDVLGTLVEPRTGNKPNAAIPGNFDDLDFLRGPVEEVTLEVAESALNKLDPDMGYMDWLAVACSLRHQFFGIDEEDAYQLFDKWSAKGEKYGGPKDTAAKWKAIRPNVAGRPPVTIRTLLHKAVEAGWDAGPLAKACFEKTEQWIKDESRTVKELFTKGVALVAATPLLSTSEEEILLNKIIDRGKKLGAKTSISILRKELKKMKKDMAAKRDDAEKTPKWTRGVVYVSGINEFFRQATGERLSPEAADNRWGKHLLSDQAADGDQSAPAEGSKPVIRPRDFLLNVIQVPDVYDYLYDPRNPNDSIVTRDKISYINTYIRDHPEPDYETSEKAGNMFRNHLLNMIENPDYVEILLDYLAYMVQHPGKKIRWAVLLQGAEGCGKSLITRVMAAVLGQRNVKEVDASILFSSSFNDWAVGAQLVSLEEVRVVGHNRHEVMNKLKPCISNNVISVNKKYRDVAQMDNVTNYILYTNHHDSLAVGEGSRRYFVLQSKLQTKEQVLELGEKYFKRFFKMLDTHPAGLRAWFETRAISPDFDPNGHAPRTIFLEELVDASASNDLMNVRQMIEDSRNPLVCKELVCSKTLLQMLEVEHGSDMGGQQLAAMLREEGYKSIGRKLVEDSRRTLWIRHKSPLEKEDLWRNVRLFVSGKIDAEGFRMLTY